MSGPNDVEERALFAAAVAEWRESANPGGKKNKQPLRIEREVPVLRATADAGLDVIRPLQQQIAQQHAQLGSQAQVIRHLESRVEHEHAAAAQMHATLQSQTSTATVDASGLMSTIAQQQAQIEAQQQMLEDMRVQQMVWTQQMEAKIERRALNASPRASQTARVAPPQQQQQQAAAAAPLAAALPARTVQAAAAAAAPASAPAFAAAPTYNAQDWIEVGGADGASSYFLHRETRERAEPGAWIEVAVVGAQPYWLHRTTKARRTTPPPELASFPSLDAAAGAMAAPRPAAAQPAAAAAAARSSSDAGTAITPGPRSALRATFRSPIEAAATPAPPRVEMATFGTQTIPDAALSPVPAARTSTAGGRGFSQTMPAERSPGAGQMQMQMPLMQQQQQQQQQALSSTAAPRVFPAQLTTPLMHQWQSPRERAQPSPQMSPMHHMQSQQPQRLAPLQYQPPPQQPQQQQQQPTFQPQQYAPEQLQPQYQPPRQLAPLQMPQPQPAARMMQPQRSQSPRAQQQQQSVPQSSGQFDPSAVGGVLLQVSALEGELRHALDVGRGGSSASPSRVKLLQSSAAQPQPIGQMRSPIGSRRPNHARSHAAWPMGITGGGLEHLKGERSLSVSTGRAGFDPAKEHTARASSARMRIEEARQTAAAIEAVSAAVPEFTGDIDDASASAGGGGAHSPFEVHETGVGSV